MPVPYGVQAPKYLDAPIQILWWEVDEFGVVFGCFCCALYFGGIWFWGSLFVVPWLYIRAKKLGSRGFLKHLIVKSGLAGIDGYPTAFENKFME